MDELWTYCVLLSSNIVLDVVVTRKKGHSLIVKSRDVVCENKNEIVILFVESNTRDNKGQHQS
jgi:hypothetical protein